MLSINLARRLQGAGLGWSPRAGDRFVVPDRGIDDEVFVLSDMTVDVHDLPTGRIIGFNGTTEWALDSLQMTEVTWLPREGQLREALGDGFVRLDAVPGGFAVTVTAGGDDHRHIDLDVEDAYARAVLDLLATQQPDSDPPQA